MKTDHSPIVAVSQPSAPHARQKVWSPNRLAGAQLAQQLTAHAFDTVPAPTVARHLGVSRELAYGWATGKTSITLADVLGGPRGFSRCLLVLARERVDLVTLAPVEPRDAVGLLLVTLGGLLVISKRPIEQLSEQELQQAIEDSRETERQAGDLARTFEAEKRRRDERKDGGR